MKRSFIFIVIPYCLSMYGFEEIQNSRRKQENNELNDRRKIITQQKEHKEKIKYLFWYLHKFFQSFDLPTKSSSSNKLGYRDQEIVLFWYNSLRELLKEKPVTLFDEIDFNWLSNQEDKAFDGKKDHEYKALNKKHEQSKEYEAFKKEQEQKEQHWPSSFRTHPDRIRTLLWDLSQYLSERADDERALLPCNLLLELLGEKPLSSWQEIDLQKMLRQNWHRIYPNTPLFDLAHPFPLVESDEGKIDPRSVKSTDLREPRQEAEKIGESSAPVQEIYQQELFHTFMKEVATLAVLQLAIHLVLHRAAPAGMPVRFVPAVQVMGLLLYKLLLSNNNRFDFFGLPIQI